MHYIYIYTLPESNMPMENPPFIDRWLSHEISTPPVKKGIFQFAMFDDTGSYPCDDSQPHISIRWVQTLRMRLESMEVLSVTWLFVFLVPSGYLT